MTTPQATTIVIDAQDRASRTINRISQGTLKNLRQSVISAGVGMLSLTKTIIGGLGLRQGPGGPDADGGVRL